MEVEVKWIKLLTRFFDDEKIKLIEAMPDADTIIVIWVKLLTLAGKKNMNGYIFLAENIPYTDEMLSTLFNRPLNTIRLALDIFKKFKMVKFNNDGIAKINNWEKHQNIEGLDKIREQGRLRQIKHREKFKQLPEKASNVTVTSHNETEEKRREEIREDKKENKTIKTKEIYKEKYPFLKDKDFTKTFKDYLDMRVSIKKKATDKAIELRLKDLHLYDIKTAIAMLENSIMNSYQGVFELNNKPNNNQQSKLQQSLKRISEFGGNDE